MREKRTWACAALLALLTPACALAVTEGVVESAPPVAVMEWAARTQEGYLPLAGNEGEEPAWEEEEIYLEPEPFDYGNMITSPRLTRGETMRARRLLERYEAGEATGDGASVLEAQKNVRAGVYRLDPDAYDGEGVLLLLPGVMLSDEQLLAIIDAYHQLGLRFDPDALDERNCVRGTASGRSLTQEEWERCDRIRLQIETGVLDAKAIDPDAVFHVQVDMRYHYGSYGVGNEAIVFPYRRMTDGEIAAYLVLIGTKCELEGLDTVLLERAAREQLTGRMGCPLSMELSSFGHKQWYRPWDRQKREPEELRKSVTLAFHFEQEDGEAGSARAILDSESGKMLSLDVDLGWIGEEKDENWLGEEAYQRLAEDYAREKLGLEGIRFAVAKAKEGGWPLYARASAALDEGQTLYIRMDLEGEVKGVRINSGFLNVPERIL